MKKIIMICYMIAVGLHASDSRQFYVGNLFSDDDLPKIKTNNAVFINCDFSKNIKIDWSLKSIDFSNSFLIGCNFTGKNLSGSKFLNATITSTSDTSAAVQAYIKQAKIDILPGIITSFAQATLDNADFSQATISASFVGASLQNSTFADAQLSQCSFSYADLNNANFQSVSTKTKIVLSSFECALNIDKALMDSGYQQIKNAGYGSRCKALKPFIMGGQSC